MNDVVIENAQPQIAVVRIGVDPGSLSGVKVKVLEADGTVVVDPPVVLGRGHSIMGSLVEGRSVVLTLEHLDHATVKGEYEVLDEETSPLIDAPEQQTTGEVSGSDAPEQQTVT